MTNYTICVPDIGGAEGAEVVELLVGVGDQIEVEQSLIVLESDKASMEIPASHAGIVSELKIAVGDELSEGDAILVIELADGEAAGAVQEETPSATAEESAVVAVDNAVVNDQPADASGSDEVREVVIAVPDIGTDGDVEVVEIPVAVGDVLEEGDSIVVLESDKASMEVPSTTGGEVLALLVEEGALVKEGSSLLRMRTSGSAESAGAASEAPAPRSEERRVGKECRSRWSPYH